MDPKAPEAAKPVVTKSRLELLEDKVASLEASGANLAKRVEAFEGKIVNGGTEKSKGKFGGKGTQGPQPMKDTVTNKLYASKSELGKDRASGWRISPSTRASISRAS